MFDLDKRLEKNCKNCKPSTRVTYKRAFERLAKLAGKESVPSTSTWLNDAFLKKLQDMPLNIHRNLLSYAIVLLKIYENPSKKWSQALAHATESYEKQRSKNKKSKNEEQNWPRGGFKALRVAASTIKRKIFDLLKKKQYTNEEAYSVQKYIILLFYSNHALRLDAATLYLKPSETHNTLLRPKGSRRFVVTLREHKTVKSMGTLQITLNAQLSKALSTYLPKIPSTHGYFLSLRNGNKMSKQSLSKLLLRLTQSLLNKRIGVRLIRVLKTSESAAQISKAKELQNELGHSAETQKGYVRK